MGGGCGLAVACDIVVASPRALFAMPEVTLGLPPAQIAPFVRARLGDRVATRLMLTGERLDAAAAHAAGLVDILAASNDSLAAEALALVNRLIAAEPVALAATKRILATARRASLAEALDEAADHFAACLRSCKAASGIAAFAAKQPAPWVATLAEWPP
jgi:isohexenylglutaconyl-CoA hydratase